MSKYFNKVSVLFFIIIVLIVACTKESSYESGSSTSSVATGTLKDSLGNCQNIAIKGNYVVDTVLTDSNYVVVTATITKPGNYKIYTDTVNGFWFRDSAYILTSGTQTFKLKGYGKPILPLTSNFTVYFNSSYCLFSIAVSSMSSTGGTVTTPSGDYFPTTTNSNWTYDKSADTVRYTCTPYIATINSKPYKLFVTSQSDSFLYRKDSLIGEYYTYGTFFSDSRFIEYKFLDDKLPLNSFWETDTLSTSSIGFPITYKIRFSVDAKNVPYTINGNIFDSVIKIRQEILVKNPGGLYSIQSAYTSYTYYAKKVGYVWYDSPTYTEKIRRWMIY